MWRSARHLNLRLKLGRASAKPNTLLLNPAPAQVSRIDFVGWVERQRNPTHYFKRVGFRKALTQPTKSTFHL
ncbi:hypothetical protein CP500_011790 [Tychonema bourrellyi FEM_GT703]|uniref:Uncharacterized protein n=1 Tax=Tychonema bourrellyi FEM_GT703 TaxID=2040638 RepID=A0A2G4F0H8_9CYAN|nr:hypothetical protein CP500_011790 [Tychonema bourrellyi FEM_GT703]